MERLTKIIKTADQKDLIVYAKGKGIFRYTFAGKMTTDDRIAVLKKLAEYEDSEEQGLLYRHPFGTIKFSKEDMQTLVDEKFKEIELDIQAIRSEAINEFAELLKGNLIRKYANANLTQQYVALQVTDWCNEIAEQLKAGGTDESI